MAARRAAATRARAAARARGRQLHGTNLRKVGAACVPRESPAHVERH